MCEHTQLNITILRTKLTVNKNWKFVAFVKSVRLKKMIVEGERVDDIASMIILNSAPVDVQFYPDCNNIRA